MTDLEKSPLHHKFNFFKKKPALQESTFVADRASNLMVIMFFQPLILMTLLVIFGFTNVKELIEIFHQHQKTIFNFGLYSMALISVGDFVSSFISPERKTPSFRSGI